MATPTSAIDDLLALLSPAEQAVMRDMILKNPTAKLALEEGMLMRKEYLGDGTSGDDAAVRAQAAADAAAKESADRIEAARVAAAAAHTAAANSNGSGDLSAITRQLTELNTNLTKQIDDLRKNVITTDKLPEYRGELLATTIRNADQAMQIRLSHEKEFPNEPFDIEKVNTFINEQATKHNRRFPDIKAAYDAMVGDKRVEARIAKGIADGLTAKRSADAASGASGGSSTPALSAGQELIRKARGEAGAQDHVVSMADKLRKIREARESREGGAEEVA